MSRKTFGAWTGEQKCHVHIFHIYILQFLVVKFKGSFKNHVDTISLIFDHPPTSVDTFYQGTIGMEEKPVFLKVRIQDLNRTHRTKNRTQAGPNNCRSL